MARRKKEHYQYAEQAQNIIQAGKPLYTTVKGHWNSRYFATENPIVAELACGKGEYTVALAAKFPDKNFIGMDIKGDRIARGSALAIEQKLQNVAFLRGGIQYSREFFAPNELDEIWLIHPDPQARDKEEKRRLTNPAFLSLYAEFIRSGGFFCLKTDSTFLYEYSMETLAAAPEYSILAHTDDLYLSPLLDDHHGVKTHYEGIFVAKGSTIKYIKAQIQK